MASGWQEDDINSGFQSLNKPAQSTADISNNINAYTDQPTRPQTAQNTPQKKIMIIVGAIIFGLFILGGSVFAYFEYFNDNSEKPAANNEKVSQDESGGKNTAAISSSDCGKDMECFIEASKNCEPSKVVNSTTLDMFGAKQTTTSTFKIKGKENDKCLFYIKTEKIDLELPPTTSEKIAVQQKEAYKKLEGKDGTCKFQRSALTALLKSWNKGSFSTEDFNEAECSGTYFENRI